jgi:hypothetical protein
MIWLFYTDIRDARVQNVLCAYLKLLPSIEDLAWCHGVLGVEHVPMVHGFCADKRKSRLADPSPELDVLLMAVCLQTLLGLEVEELQRPTLRLKSDNRLSQVHDGAVGADRSPDDIVCVLEVDDDRLGGGVGFVVHLAHANVLVGLERLDSCQHPVHVGLAGASPHTQFCHVIDADCITY